MAWSTGKFGEVMGDIGYYIFKLAYSKFPIWLNGGVALTATQNTVAFGSWLIGVEDKLPPNIYVPVPLPLLPDVFGLLIQYVTKALEGGGAGDIEQLIDGLFMDWLPSSSTLFNTDIATYPFANQATAGEAQIRRPESLDMLLRMPAGQEGHYTILSALNEGMMSAFKRHAVLGGTYTVLTPQKVWSDMILKSVQDVTSDQATSPGMLYLYHFERPLVDRKEFGAIASNRIQALQNGQQIDRSPFEGRGTAA